MSFFQSLKHICLTLTDITLQVQIHQLIKRAKERDIYMSAGCVNMRKQSAYKSTYKYMGRVKQQQQQYHSVFIDI